MENSAFRIASQRFLREEAWASRVRHPNAVEVYDYGVSDNGIPYLVMELLEGHTLTDELRRTGPLSPERCAAILGPVCAALEAAHVQGITHRDVKPDNIFLHHAEGIEVPKLLDFGLAKRSDPDTGELLRHSLQAGVSQFTRTGQVIGTPLYIAPERWLGSTGAPGDIYSLGVVFYLMLCGLDVGNRMQTGFLQGNPFGPCGPRTWPPIAQFRADVPMPVEEILQGMLHSDPGARPSLERVRWALGTFAGSEMTA